MNVVGSLIQAKGQYDRSVSPTYDEVLFEVSGRVLKTRSVGKSDIGALLFWKRLRADTPWVARLHALPDADVRAASAVAVTAVTDERLGRSEAARRGRAALAGLPGFESGDALASAALLAAAPGRMAIYDRRAQRGIERLGLKLTTASGRYGRYMELIEQLLGELHKVGHDWIPRDVDVALY